MSVLLLLSPEMAKMCKSAARGFASPFRQGGELAEGQKGENVKDIRAAPPPLRQPLEMAEGAILFGTIIAPSDAH